MTKEELHKAASEMYLEKTGWESFSDVEEWTDPTETVELMVNFHLHQTKKMLEGWIENVVPSNEFGEIPEGWNSENSIGFRQAIKQLCNELLKQLEG